MVSETLAERVKDWVLTRVGYHRHNYVEEQRRYRDGDYEDRPRGLLDDAIDREPEVRFRCRVPRCGDSYVERGYSTQPKMRSYARLKREHEESASAPFQM